MTDSALFDWIASGAKVDLSADDAAAKQQKEFSARFVAALYPADDLGPTEELHQAAVASQVYAVHMELCRLGDEVYNAVWSTLSAPVRAAIKRYIIMGRDQ